MMREAIVGAVSVLLALGASIGYQWIAARQVAPRLAQVDVLAVADTAQKRFESIGFDPKASEAERTQAIVAARTFGMQLDQAVAQIAEQCRCVLLNRSAIVGVATGEALPDYTNALRALLAKRAKPARRHSDGSD